MIKQSFNRLILNLLLLVLAQGAAVAQGNSIEDGGVVYKNQNGEWVVFGLASTFTGGNITLKSTISVAVFDNETVDFPVRKITPQAFRGKTSINGVTISEGITTIGSEAFEGCSGITHLVLPSTITTLESNALGRGANLRWVDCRAVPAMSASGWLSDSYHSPYNLGIDKHTLIYMPVGCTKSNYPYTNAVFTDADGNRTCLHFDFPRNMDYCVPWDFTADEVSAYPDLQKDKDAYSLCLPYSQPVPQGAKVYELRSRDDNDVYFGLVSGGINAFTPYLIVAADNNVAFHHSGSISILSTSDAENQLQTASEAGVTLHGTLKRINNSEAAERYYVLQVNNEWKLVPSNSTVGVPPFRVYLTLDGSQPTNLLIDMEDDTESIPYTVFNYRCPEDDAWYTLQGQRLSSVPTVPGVYIHHNQKQVVR